LLGIGAELWQPMHLVEAACSRLQHSLAPERWRLLFPDENQVPTCATPRPREGTSR
jgi:hypothetical protein